jgi:hypothetical protein
MARRRHHLDPIMFERWVLGVITGKQAATRPVLYLSGAGGGLLVRGEVAMALCSQ